MSKNQTKVLAGRIGGLTKAARSAPEDLTRAATAGMLARFEREADPDNTLPADERRRRAEALRKAHMTRLALRSAQARKARASGAS